MTSPVRRREVLAALAMSFTRGRTAAQNKVPERLEAWLSATPAERKQALAACLDRIQRMDGSIRAWVQVAPQPQIADGPLAGIPFAAKDVMETRDLLTEYGSPIYKGRHGTSDAAFIQQLRGLGAILLGKTHTAQFAHRTPAPTRNPRDLEHTPGGSSSGSAAAVAAGMTPFALGTQTAGSILRPASYCGVTGFKPTYGTLPMEGVLPFSRSLDTLGLFTSTPLGMLRLWEALGKPVGRAEALPFGAPEPPLEAEPAMTAAFAEAIAQMRRRGFDIRPVPLQPILGKLVQETRVIMYYEGARFHAERYKQYGDRLEAIAELVREGLQIPEARHRQALAVVEESRSVIARQFQDTPILLVPAATGPAPQGLAFTGDSRMNAPWTALGTPAISIPMPVQGGLPLGLQLTGAPGQDARVLQAAARAAEALGAG